MNNIFKYVCGALIGTAIGYGVATNNHTQDLEQITSQVKQQNRSQSNLIYRQNKVNIEQYKALQEGRVKDVKKELKTIISDFNQLLKTNNGYKRIPKEELEAHLRDVENIVNQ